MSAGFGGSMTFIKKLTASGSGTLSFVDGASGVVLDDTYKEYVFTFNNIHPETDVKVTLSRWLVQTLMSNNINLLLEHIHEADGLTTLAYTSGRIKHKQLPFKLVHTI